jgi:co-chaperonin GroES (HSP10)
MDTDTGITLLASLGSGPTYLAYYAGGTPIGRVTASGKGRPCGSTLCLANQVGATVIQVGSAANFAVGDAVTVRDVSAGTSVSRTVSALSKTATPNTLTLEATTVDVGDTIKLSNGAGTAVGILAEDVEILSKKGRTASYVERSGRLIRHGVVYESKVVGFNSEIEDDLSLVIFED